MFMILHSTLKNLIDGNRNVTSVYLRIKTRWENILRDFNWEENSINNLTKIIYDNQLAMEGIAQQGSLGQEAMVSVIFFIYADSSSQSYNIDYARIIYTAFLKSYCSLEVINLAIRFAEYYGIASLES
jgi:hypothetical protein